MSNMYHAKIRDATMQMRKALMCSALSEAMVEVGGTPDLGRDVEKILETFARNGIEARFMVVTGPYVQTLLPDGTVDYS